MMGGFLVGDGDPTLMEMCVWGRERPGVRSGGMWLVRNVPRFSVPSAAPHLAVDHMSLEEILGRGDGTVDGADG